MKPPHTPGRVAGEHPHRPIRARGLACASGLITAAVACWLTLAASSVWAQGPAERRLLLPAASFHSNDKDGRIVRQRSLSTVCDPTCRTAETPEQREFTEFNPGLGLEWTWRDPQNRATKAYGQVVRDSYGKASLMVGAGYLWPINQGRWQVDAGFTGGLWWRSQMKFRNQTATFQPCDPLGPPCAPASYTTRRSEVTMKLVPFVFPVLTVSDRVSGYGLNVALVPRVTSGERIINSTNTVLVQLTKTF